MHTDPDPAAVGDLLDAFAAAAHPMVMRSVADTDGTGDGVPRAMWDGDVDEEGWVRWTLLPGEATAGDVAGLEATSGVALPPVWRAYLRARCHLFDQVHSRAFGNLIFMTAVPAGDPLGPFTRLLAGWRGLIPAGFAPLCEYGDGWGPVCLDTTRVREDGDGPLVWFDHEILCRLPPADLSNRAAVLPHAQPLWESCRAMLWDVFDPAGRGLPVAD